MCVLTGPRFVLNLIKIFGGSFGGPILYEHPHYVSPNVVSGRVTVLAEFYICMYTHMYVCM